MQQIQCAVYRQGDGLILMFGQESTRAIALTTRESLKETQSALRDHVDKCNRSQERLLWWAVRVLYALTAGAIAVVYDILKLHHVIQ